MKSDDEILADVFGISVDEIEQGPIYYPTHLTERQKRGRKISIEESGLSVEEHDRQIDLAIKNVQERSKPVRVPKRSAEKDKNKWQKR